MGSRLEPRYVLQRSLLLARSPLRSAGQGQSRGSRPLPEGRVPGLMGLGTCAALTRALEFPLAEPQRSVWSPGAVEPVPEEKESWEGSSPVWKGGEAAHKGELQFPARSRKEINPNH